MKANSPETERERESRERGKERKVSVECVYVCTLEQSIAGKEESQLTIPLISVTFLVGLASL